MAVQEGLQDEATNTSGPDVHSAVRALGMSGPHLLSDAAITETLERVSPGNYALGYMDGESFGVFYVGRSDADVRQRLRDWVGMPSPKERYSASAKAPWGLHRRGRLPVDSPALRQVGNVDTRYTHFAYSYATSPDDAYAKEWRDYDAFGGRRGLDNQTQPTP